MPRDGSGNYSLPAGTTAVSGQVIESADFNSVNSDVASALSDSINKNGTKAMAANLAMGSNKITGLAAGTAATDAPTLRQAQSDAHAQAATVGGTVDAITLVMSPVYTSYVTGMRIRWRSGGVNTVTNPTVNVDSLGAKTLKKGAAAALAAADTGAAGYQCEAVYDGTDFILLNPAAVPSASDTDDIKQGVHTVWLPAAAWTAKSTNGCGFSLYDSGSNDVTLPTLDFDTTTQEYAHTCIAMPKSWNEGTVTFIPYWTNTGGTASQTLVLSLAGAAISNDDTLNATMGTAQTSSDVVIAQNDLHIGPESSAITIGGSPAENDMVVLELSRVVASDNMAGDAKVIGIKLMMTINATTDA